MRIAVIGGGLTGLSCTIRLAQRDHAVTLFESAPDLGGRTRSFYDRTTHVWVDNGPHLLIGAYSATRALLQEAGAADHIHWQSSLKLPLWDNTRGLFTFSPKRALPFPLAMLLAASRLPGHGIADIPAMVRLARAGRLPVDVTQSVASWLDHHDIPTALRRDILDPLCLGAMNESPDSANAASFASVLREAFSGHHAARLGWFRMPLSQALIEPLEKRASRLGVEICTGKRIRRIRTDTEHVDVETSHGSHRRFDMAVLAVSARARNSLLGWPQRHETGAITNIHLWFKQPLSLPSPLVGGIGTYGHWFFDIGRQMDHDDTEQGHICAVISADPDRSPAATCIPRICRELGELLDMPPPTPFHHRLVREHRATTLVRPAPTQPVLPDRLIDASEQPLPGEFPATIEWAVRRGEQAAETASNTCLT